MLPAIVLLWWKVVALFQVTMRHPKKIQARLDAKRSVADNETRIGVSVTVYCCTRSWDGVEAFIDSGQWGSWSPIRTWGCPDTIFDQQVRVRVNMCIHKAYHSENFCFAPVTYIET